mgnify:FL=1
MKEYKKMINKSILNIALVAIILVMSVSFCWNALAEVENNNELQPYLQAVTHNSIYILVETESKDPVFAEYKKANDDKTLVKSSSYVETEQRRSPSYVHRIQLDSLSSGTEYSYRAFNDKDTTRFYSFFTSANKGKEFRFAVAGDMRSNPEIFANVCGDIKKFKPRFSIYTGDVCYNDKYYSWKKEFLIPEHMELIAEVPFFNAIGNHEGWEQNTRAFQQAPESDSDHEAYYSFDFGDMHVLILSSEHGVGRKSKQWKFAEEDLKNSNSKWKVVAFHIPAYCGGGHGENSNMKRMTTEIFEPNGVDFVFTGHSHFYQHNLVNGIHHFVLAGGGAPLYSDRKSVV